MHPRGAQDGAGPEVEVSCLAIARLHPTAQLWESPANLSKHVAPVNVVESILEVHLQAPPLLGRDDLTVDGGPGGVDHRLASSSYSHPKLQRAEHLSSWAGHLAHDDLGREPPEDVADCHWPISTGLLDDGEEIGAKEEGRHRL